MCVRIWLLIQLQSCKFLFLRSRLSVCLMHAEKTKLWSPRKLREKTIYVWSNLPLSLQENIQNNVADLLALCMCWLIYIWVLSSLETNFIELKTSRTDQNLFCNCMFHLQVASELRTGTQSLLYHSTFSPDIYGYCYVKKRQSNQTWQ